MNTKKRNKMNKFLSQLPKGLKKRVINNTSNKSFADIMKDDTVGGWLWYGFTWTCSEETGAFWSDVVDLLELKQHVTSLDYKNLRNKFKLVD